MTGPSGVQPRRPAGGQGGGQYASVPSADRPEGAQPPSFNGKRDPSDIRDPSDLYEKINQAYLDNTPFPRFANSAERDATVDEVRRRMADVMSSTIEAAQERLYSLFSGLTELMDHQMRKSLESIIEGYTYHTGRPTGFAPADAGTEQGREANAEAVAEGMVGVVIEARNRIRYLQGETDKLEELLVDALDAYDLHSGAMADALGEREEGHAGGNLAMNAKHRLLASQDNPS